MVIYIDILVVLNAFITFLILLGVFSFLREPASGIRLVLSSAFGGLFSLVILLPDMGRTVSVLLKIIGAVIITLIAFRISSFKRFLRFFACVFAVSFIFAGAMLALYILIKPDKMAFNNGAVYFEISVRLFVISACVCYLIIKLILFLTKRLSPDNRICTLTLELNSKSAVIKGLIDTGNNLSDVFTAAPVTTVEKSALRQLIGSDINERKGVVPVKTALGTGMLYTVRFDRMVITYGKSKWIILSPIIALAENDLSDGEYSALVNPKIFETGSSTYEKTVEQNK